MQEPQTQVAPTPDGTTAAQPAEANAQPPNPLPASNGATADVSRQAQPDEAAAAASAPTQEAQDPLPENANETVYVNNLNEKVKIEVLKASLTSLFSTYGRVLSVTAHSNLRMRGQAFVAFADKRTAARAVKEVAGFPLYGKPMQLAFAKTPSDAVVKLRVRESEEGDDGEEEESDVFKQHKRERLEWKKRQRRGNVLRRRELASKIAAKKAASGEVPADSAAAAQQAAAAAPKKPAVPQLPDEYLPPNKILFIQNLPTGATRDDLERAFAPFGALQDVRTIPNKPLAFVEFGDVATSARAREQLNGTALAVGSEGGAAEGVAEEEQGRLRITFARA